MIEVTTNHHWRELLYRGDVPEEVLQSQFDWQNEDYEANGSYSTGFVCYHGHWYHTSDFLRSETDGGKWHGAAADGFFSGVLIRISADGERCQLGTYCVRS